jgi:chaperonin cofactor prefoldin
MHNYHPRQAWPRESGRIVRQHRAIEELAVANASQRKQIAAQQQEIVTIKEELSQARSDFRQRYRLA